MEMPSYVHSASGRTLWRRRRGGVQELVIAALAARMLWAPLGGALRVLGACPLGSGPRHAPRARAEAPSKQGKGPRGGCLPYVPHRALQSQVRWFHQSTPWYLASRVSMFSPADSSASEAPASAGAGRGHTDAHGVHVSKH